MKSQGQRKSACMMGLVSPVLSQLANVVLAQLLPSGQQARSYSHSALKLHGVPGSGGPSEGHSVSEQKRSACAMGLVSPVVLSQLANVVLAQLLPSGQQTRSYSHLALKLHGVSGSGGPSKGHSVSGQKRSACAMG
eukprot:CAMPEP_0194054544 /NCGR_PEP_ID=MMETSP0009_2-20130614/53715_1 /TAXON_ID=210454 /ORGANISM="Grammatophora oceanica, Strain CCMP 410" /LENGTH=135 /DNA_ID=CAMNT_0038703063 /DNA_START=59 /DNA_END=462 /DNA_ORIENTATION=-